MHSASTTVQRYFVPCKVMRFRWVWCNVARVHLYRMVYVRGPPDEPPIESYVKKVWFFLHESYKPHDVLEVCVCVAQTPAGWVRLGGGCLLCVRCQFSCFLGSLPAFSCPMPMPPPPPPPVKINAPPFHLTRHGWGEFPLRVQVGSPHLLEDSDEC
jgi:hypothetical protein